MRSFVLARLAVSLQPLLVLFSDYGPSSRSFPFAYWSASFSSELAVRYIWCEACGLIPSIELAE